MPIVPLPYPFQEFLGHLAASGQFLRYEHVTIAGELREIGSAQTMGSFPWRVGEYMKDVYPNRDEAIYKAHIFIQVHEFISGRQHFFARHKLICPSEKERRANIALPLFRAVHHVFTDPDLSPRASSVEPKQVLALAKAFYDLEDDSDTKPSAGRSWAAFFYSVFRRKR